MPLCTVITDASFGGRGYAGWAAWVKASGPSSLVGGPVTGLPFENAPEAELIAIVHGLQEGFRVAPGHDLLLQSDCQHALLLLKWRLGFKESVHKQATHSLGPARECRCSPNEDKLVRLVGALVQAQESRVRVLVRHVKGHLGNEGRAGEERLGRHRVNAMCDDLAKFHMRAMRKAAGLQGNGQPWPKTVQQEPTCP